MREIPSFDPALLLEKIGVFLGALFDQLTAVSALHFLKATLYWYYSLQFQNICVSPIMHNAFLKNNKKFIFLIYAATLLT